MPNIEKKALELVNSIYAAGLDQQQWPVLIESIAASVDALGGMLRLVDYSNQRVGFFKAAGYEPKFTQAYCDYFVTLDPYRDFFENSPVGTLMASTMHPNFKSLLGSEFHADYMRPQGREYLAGATLARDGNITVQFGIQRSKQAGDFGEDDMQLLRLLSPHLTRAIQVHRLIGETAASANLAFASLDRIRVGIFLVDAGGKVLHINRAGEKLLASGELAVKQKQLMLNDVAATVSLSRLIASASQPSLVKTLECGGMLRLSPSGNKPGLELRVMPVPNAMGDYSMQAGCTAVFVSRPGSLKLPWQRVASAYGLSPAEAKLAVLLAEGCRPEEAAERLFISINTVRTQMKSIFAKTGIRRQPELLTLLLGGVLSWFAEEDELNG